MTTLKNTVRLIGHVGHVPEIKKMKNGRKLAKFSIATNEVYYNNKGEKVNRTYWHNIVAWGKTAEIIDRYVDKGKEIAIEGKLTNRAYDTPEGYKRYVTEIVINEILMLNRNKQQN
jgi:single-strand DNA-binding protein